jgi:hypothetical protein
MKTRVKTKQNKEEKKRKKIKEIKRESKNCNLTRQNKK